MAVTAEDRVRWRNLVLVVLNFKILLPQCQSHITGRKARDRCGKMQQTLRRRRLSYNAAELKMSNSLEHLFRSVLAPKANSKLCFTNGYEADRILNSPYL
jgi:hypothetical protein